MANNTTTNNNTKRTTRASKPKPVPAPTKPNPIEEAIAQYASKILYDTSDTLDRLIKLDENGKLQFAPVSPEELCESRPVTGERYLGTVRVPNDTRVTQLNNNDLIIGSSGAGKTGGYILPNIANGDTSFICADTKCSLYKNNALALMEKGYEVYCLDFVDPKNSCVYNPLDYIRIDEKTGKCRQQDIISIAHTLLPAELDKNEMFWVNSARIVLEMLINYVMEAFEPEYRSLAAVAEVYKALLQVRSEDIVKDGIPFMERWAVDHQNSRAVELYRMIIGVSKADKTWGCIMAFVTTAITPYTFDEVQGVFSGRSTIRFEELGRKKCALFLNISDTDRCMDKLVNTLYTQALQALCREADSRTDNRLRVPTRIYLDDFASNVVIPDFDKIISVIRSREIYVSVILQSYSQLESIYDRSCALTIVNNCDHILYLGSNDVDTADFLAARACKTPEDIMQMPCDKAYVLTRGQKALLVDKIKPYSITVGSKENRNDSDAMQA